jgi:uncharacterized protein (TIGR03000 family)
MAIFREECFMNRAALALCVCALMVCAGGFLLAQPGVITAPPDRAVIVVTAPADAMVSVGGQLSAQRGPERHFYTGPLAPGSYAYDIVATWRENGKEKKDQRTVTFRPGEVKLVNFVQPAGAAKKTEAKVPEKTPTEKKPQTDKKGPDKKQETTKKTTEVWTDPADPTLPADFQIQGEYVGNGKDAKLGCQIIALGGGELQAVVLPGGLPGAGWDGKIKSLMQGHIEGDRATFTPATGNRRYIAGPPSEFSATKYPPPGQKNYTGSADGKTMTINDEGKTIHLTKTVRKSPTLGTKAPAGAVVLFDGTNTAEWEGGRLIYDKRSPLKEFAMLATEGRDVRSKKRFNNYTVHLEFMLPYRPAARGQGRGNSGFYQVMQYEVQILDSFGLDGRKNECGAIYETVAPSVNMCLPALQWQTYDIDFTNAVPDPTNPKKVAQHSRITAKHNGVVILDNFEIPRPTGGAWGQPEGTPGPLLLQGHGNPLQFRNIWVAEKK